MKVKAYIAEDDLLSSAILNDMLTDHYPQVEVVGKGETVSESVAFLSRNEVDLLFLDVEFPDGSGQDILDCDSAGPFGVIITTSYPESCNKFNSGVAAGVIIKPVTLATLSTAMNRFGMNV